MYRQYFLETEFKHGLWDKSYLEQFAKIERACQQKNNSSLIILLTGDYDKEEKAWTRIFRDFGGPHGYPSQKNIRRIQKVANYLFGQYFQDVWQFGTSLRAFKTIAKKTYWHDPWHDPHSKEVQPVKQLWELLGIVERKV
jgi:hypothetical protein